MSLMAILIFAWLNRSLVNSVKGESCEIPGLQENEILALFSKEGFAMQYKQIIHAYATILQHQRAQKIKMAIKPVKSKHFHHEPYCVFDYLSFSGLQGRCLSPTPDELHRCCKFEDYTSKEARESRRLLDQHLWEVQYSKLHLRNDSVRLARESPMFSNGDHCILKNREFKTGILKQMWKRTNLCLNISNPMPAKLIKEALLNSSRSGSFRVIHWRRGDKGTDCKTVEELTDFLRTLSITMPTYIATNEQNETVLKSLQHQGVFTWLQVKPHLIRASDLFISELQLMTLASELHYFKSAMSSVISLVRHLRMSNFLCENAQERLPGWIQNPIAHS
eukprot:m.164668 g.164668  ORF g.164668 m.164668 type:complete len:335 (+) comp15242_c0_seq10:213-1217(+)